MAVENDNSSSMSDKDRDMTRRFGGEARDEHIEKKDNDDDSDDEKESSKDSKKSDDKRPLKRALFIRSDDAESGKEKHTQSTVEKARKGFLGLLREEDQPSSEPGTQETEQQPVEVESTAEDEVVQEEFQDLVVERLAEVESELEQPQIDNAQEILADASYLEDVGERVEEGLSPEQAIEDAYEDQLTPPEADAQPADLEDMSNFEEDEVIDLNQNMNNSQQNPNVVPPHPQNPNAVPLTPIVPLTLRGGGARGGGTGTGGGVPPIVPFGPANPNANNVPPQNPNSLANNPNLVAMNEFYYRKKKSRDLLVGGIVGYMIGRRGGRKRTEARFEPQMRKKDEVIGSLREKLVTTEDKVRELSRTKASETFDSTLKIEHAKREKVPTSEHKPDKPIAPIVEKVEEPYDREPDSIEVIHKHITELKVDTVDADRKMVEAAEQAFEDTLGIRNENEVLETPQQIAPEKIEHVLEASPTIERIIQSQSDRGEKIDNRLQDTISYVPENAPMPAATLEKRWYTPDMKKDPRTMTMPELLEVAEYIHLEKTSLKELYEHHRIDAVNVRRVVLEYMNGGNRYEKMLRGSLEAVEMQRELRHEMKQTDGGFSQSGGGVSDGSQTTMNTSTDVLVSQNNGNTEPNALLDASAKAVKDEVDERLMVSNGTAVVLGILMGIAIMIMLLFYSDVL